MMETVLWIVIILFSIMIHEVSHGLMAWALGDRTARDEGRLTLNPLKHIDLFWTILLPAVLYFTTGGKFALGMAKPVPVNFNRLRSPRRDTILVALAGPLANLVIAAVLGRIWTHFSVETALYAAYLNVGLAAFNLFPVPPLDGSRILGALLPSPAYRVYFRYERFGFLVIAALYLSGILMKILIPGVETLASWLRLPPLTLEL